MLNEEVLQYIEKHWEEGYELLLTLAQIPARNGWSFVKTGWRKWVQRASM